MPRARALAVLIGLALPVVAQRAGAQPAADLWPLVPGNSWTYVSQSYDTRDILGGFHWTAVDSVDTPAGRLPGLRRGDEPGPAECVVRVAQGGEGPTVSLLDPQSGTLPCTAIRFGLPGSQNDLGLSVQDTTEVWVGGEWLGPRAVRAEYLDGGQGVSWSYANRFTSGVGHLDHYYSVRALGAQSSSTGYTLRRAVLSGTVIGQPLESRADFWPLEVGNRWEFALASDAGANGAVAWTVVPSGAGVALRLDRFEGGVLTASVTCPVSVGEPGPATGWHTGFLAACTLPDPTLFPSLEAEPSAILVDVYAHDATFGVGGQSVTADVTSWTRMAHYSGTYQAFAPRASARLARHVGPYAYTVKPPYSVGTPQQTWTGTLGYARVGGVEYGQQVVASDGAPGAPVLALAVGPNPASATARVRFTLAAPSAATRLAVVDALGRRVASVDLGARAAGSGDAAVDVSRLAPGLYTVRLTAGDAAATTRLSVVR